MATPDVRSTIAVDADTSGAATRIRGLSSIFNTEFGRIAGAVGVGSAAASLFTAGITGVFGAIRSFTSTAVGWIQSSIQFNATLESATKQFTTLIGSASEARTHVKSLFDFAAHTPFESGEIIAASQALRSAGGAALDTRANLTTLGNAAAATGKPITDISLWVGRVYANLQAGRPFGEAAQRLTELNVITPQTRIALENMLKTTKDGPAVFQAFMGTLSRFNGAMKEQETTWKGVTSTFHDTINSLSATAFAPVFETLRDLIGQANEFLSSDAIQQWAKDVALWLQVNLPKAIAVGKDFVIQFLQALREIAPILTLAKNAFGGILSVLTDFLRAFNALPTPVKAFGLALGSIVTVGPSVFDALNRISGGAFGVYEKLTLTQRATAATNLLISAMTPGLQAFGGAWSKVGPAMADSILSSGLVSGALSKLRSIILATQLNVGSMVLSTFPSLTKATVVVANANDFLTASFARLKVAMSFLLAGTVILGLLAALGASLWQVAKAVDGAWKAFREGRLIDFLSAKDSDNWVRRWLGLGKGIDAVSQAASSLYEELSGLRAAQDVEALAQAAQKLNDAGQLSGRAVSQIAARVAEFREQGVPIPPMLERITKSFKDLTGPVEGISATGGPLDAFAGKAGTVDKTLTKWQDSFKNATSDIKTLSGAQIEGIRFFLEMGESVSEAAKLMGVFEHQVEQVKSLDDFNDRLKEAQSSLKTLSAEQIEAIRYWHAQGAAIDDIAKIQGVYKQEVEAVIETDKSLADAQRIELTITKGLGSSLKDLGDIRENEIAGLKKNADAVGALNKRLIELNRDLAKLSPFDRQREELNDWINDQEGALDYSVAGWETAYGKIHEVAKLTLEKIAADEKKAAFEGLLDRLGKLSQALANLSQIGGRFGNFVQGIATAIGAFNAAAQAGVSFGAGIDEFLGRNGKQKDWQSGAVDVATSVLTMVSAFNAATNSGSRMANAIGGALTGAKIGSTIGSIFGPVGAMVGQLAGGIIGGLVGAFKKPEWKKVMNDVGRDFGVDISEGLAKQIETDSKKIGDRTAAVLKNLGAIIQEAGGINAKNIDLYTAKTRDLFSQIERGTLSIQDVQKSVGEVFPMLAEQIKKSNGLASASFVDLIKLDRQFGTDIKAIADFVADQIDNVVVPAWGKFTDAHKSAMDRYADDEKKVRDLVEQRNKIDAERAKIGPVGPDNARANELDKQWDDLTAKIKEATKARIADEAAINATTIQTQAAATGITEAIAATFDQLREQGKSTREALKILGPTIEDIAAQLDKAGFSGTAAFNEIASLARAAGDPIVAGVLDPLEAVTDIMKGLTNTGQLTQTMFTGLAEQAKVAMDTLIATGHGGDEALRLMAPTLQLLWQEQHDFGLKTDEATQKMLDEAEAAGVVGEAHRSAAERSAIAQERVVTVLEAMAKKMGVDIPDAANKMAAGIGDAANRAGTDINTKTGGALDGIDEKLLDPRWRDWYIAGRDAASGVGDELKTKVISPTDEIADKLKKTPWAEFKTRADGPIWGITTGLGGIVGRIVTIGDNLDSSARDFKSWSDDAVDASDNVKDAINSLNFGDSPGGLKEIGPMLRNAVAMFGTFRNSGISAAMDVKRQVDALRAASPASWDASMPEYQSAASRTADQAPVAGPTIHQSFQFHIDALDAESFNDKIDTHIAPRVMRAAKLNIADTGSMLNELLPKTTRR